MRWQQIEGGGRGEKKDRVNESRTGGQTEDAKGHHLMSK